MNYYIMSNGKETQLVNENNLCDKEFLEEMGNYKNIGVYVSEISYKNDYDATRDYIQNLNHDNIMTLKQYLKENKVDKIKNDLEFVEKEREAVLDYLELNNINQDNISQEDLQELICRGFEEDIFIND